MKSTNVRRIAGAIAVLSLVAAACGDDDDDDAAPTADDTATEEAPAASTAAPAATTAAPAGTGEAATCESLDPVTLQLQWFIQSQFAGYYAALDQGFYEDQCIDLTILEGEDGRIFVDRGSLKGKPVEEMTEADKTKLHEDVVKLHGR